MPIFILVRQLVLLVCINSALIMSPLKYLSLAVPNGLRIEHLCDIIPKAQSWLVLNLPVSIFVYIHFNIPQPE